MWQDHLLNNLDALSVDNELGKLKMANRLAARATARARHAFVQHGTVQARFGRPRSMAQHACGLTRA